MYGGLSQLRGDVHGMHDAVHEDGKNGHEDDVHVHGLHGDVPNVRQWHDAHVSNERKDVHDVLRNVYDVRNHVRGDGRRSDDEAMRRDVPPVRRVVFDDCKDDEGRLATETRGQRTLPPSPTRRSPVTVMLGLFANQESLVTLPNPLSSIPCQRGWNSLCA